MTAVVASPDTGDARWQAGFSTLNGDSALFLLPTLVGAASALTRLVRSIPRSNRDFSCEFDGEDAGDGSAAPARPAIAFYFDFTSPQGYFAANRFEQLAARYGRAVRWCPILMPARFKLTGAVPLPPVPLKGAYTLRDVERTARLHGIAYQQPKNFPIIILAPARAMLWIESVYGHQAAVEFAKRAYDAFLRQGSDICDPAALASIAADQGVDGRALLAGAQSASIKQRFVQANENAIGQGVFGSPFVIVDGESFWGFDDLYQVEARLQQAAA